MNFHLVDDKRLGAELAARAPQKRGVKSARGCRNAAFNRK
jgi:hypothetical protein